MTKTKALQDGLKKWRDKGGKIVRTKVKQTMSRTRAVKAHCLDCAGETANEVVLCQVFDCPIWEWRFGSHYLTPGNLKRTRGVLARLDDAVHELKLLGIDPGFFTDLSPDRRLKWMKAAREEAVGPTT